MKSLPAEREPCTEVPEGPVIEIPIAFIAQLLFLRGLRAKRPVTAPGIHSGSPGHTQPYYPVEADAATHYVPGLAGRVSISLLFGGRRRVTRHDRHFVTLGHTKAITPYSLDGLAEFVRRVSPQQFGLLSDIEIPVRT